MATSVTAESANIFCTHKVLHSFHVMRTKDNTHIRPRPIFKNRLFILLTYTSSIPHSSLIPDLSYTELWWLWTALCVGSSLLPHKTPLAVVCGALAHLGLDDLQALNPSHRCSPVFGKPGCRPLTRSQTESPVAVRAALCHLWSPRLLPTPSRMFVHLGGAVSGLHPSTGQQRPPLSPSGHAGPPQGCMGFACTDSPHPPPGTSFQGYFRHLTGRDGVRAGLGASGKGQTAPLGWNAWGRHWGGRIVLFAWRLKVAEIKINGEEHARQNTFGG